MKLLACDKFRLPILLAAMAGCGSQGQDGMMMPPAQCALGKSWTLVDNFALSSTNVFTFPQAFLVDKKGGLYVVHQAKDSAGLYNWAVRKSIDDGATWTTIHTFQLTPGQDSTINAGSGVDSQNNLYLTGTGTDAAGVQHWLVRKSSDGGVSWTTVNDYFNSSAMSAVGDALLIDSNDTLYTVGHTNTGVAHWLVRKSTDRGSTFSMMDDFQYLNQYAATPRGIRLDSTGSIYVSGDAADAGGKRHAIVRKSAGGGSNFLTADDFQLVSGKSSVVTVAYPMGTDPLLPLFNMVSPLDGTDSRHWVTRRSLDAGVTWTTADDPSPAPLTSASGQTINSDGFGGILAMGILVDTTNSAGVIRRSTDNGATWTEFDRVTMLDPSYPYTNPDLLFSDTKKNLFQPGYICNSSTATTCRSFVRKLPCVTP